eukprot:Lithocolla_globosa_v1_NODE_58_length_7390_cov_243.140014.p9 type:complete len:107 gc:universal NODE_58_length_7390_cov_243.140014:7000-6680(-)
MVRFVLVLTMSPILNGIVPLVSRVLAHFLIFNADINACLSLSRSTSNGVNFNNAFLGVLLKFLVSACKSFAQFSPEVMYRKIKFLNTRIAASTTPRAVWSPILTLW